MKAVELQQAREPGPFMNRTGLMTNPDLSADLIQGAKSTVPSSKGSGAAIAEMRAEYMQQALPIGSKPMMTNGQEETDATNEAQPEAFRLLLDKMGERLAFERQGVRLYETVLQKFEVVGGNGDGPALTDLRHIYEEEMEHFTMLQKIITDLGGDATVQTPSADVSGVLSHGILQIVTDPRTTPAQTLQAMLNAELADNDGWQMLINLSSALGHSDSEEQFQKALEEEQEHLENVRGWLESMTLLEANGADVAAAPGGASRSRKRKGPARAASTKKRKKK
jgi:rubrerythrin